MKDAYEHDLRIKAIRLYDDGIGFNEILRRMQRGDFWPTKWLRRFREFGEEAEKLLETAVTKLGFSARAYDRVLNVARTVADMAGEADIGTAHISKAIPYRMMDRVR